MNRRRIADFPAGAPPPLFEAFNSKVLRIVFRHEELKLSFHQLRSQIGTGFREAEDVFSALSVQLVKLVGLKTAEMSEERRFTTVFTTFDGPQSQFVVKWQDEDYMNKAMKTSNELMEKQKLQVIQLIKILKNIESQVNSSQKSMFEDLSSHQVFIRKLFMKASSFVSSGFGHNNDQCLMMQKILKVTFNHVRVALGSVEAGLEDMISELAKKMCNPMVEYVRGLRVEMQAGTCSSFLELVGKMHEEMKVKELELEKARNQVEFVQEMREAIKAKELELEKAKNQTQLSEQRTIEALSRLERSEETAKKLAIALRLLTDKTTSQQEEVKRLELEVTRNQTRLTAQQSGSEALIRLENSQETSQMTGQQEEHVRRLEEARNKMRSAQQSRIDALSKLKKFEGTAKKQHEERSSTLREDQEAKDDSLMWELLSTQKRKSPSSPDELQSIGMSSKKPPSKRASLPSHSHRPITRSQFRRANLESTTINSKRILRSSPSATTQRVLCGKRIIP